MYVWSGYTELIKHGILLHCVITDDLNLLAF